MQTIIVEENRRRSKILTASKSFQSNALITSLLRNLLYSRIIFRDNLLFISKILEGQDLWPKFCFIETKIGYEPNHLLTFRSRPIIGFPISMSRLRQALEFSHAILHRVYLQSEKNPIFRSESSSKTRSCQSVSEPKKVSNCNNWRCFSLRWPNIARDC